MRNIIIVIFFRTTSLPDCLPYSLMTEYQSLKIK
nr:MAG TPA: hypothetical protein [Bacteriophage sp.]